MKEKPINLFLKFWLPVMLYASLIYYVSSIPQLPIPIKFPYLDKLLHVLEYSILGFLIKRALGVSSLSLDVKRLYLLTMLLCLLYGLSDEFHQFFVPGREMAVGDVYSDAIGGLIGAFFHR